MADTVKPKKGKKQKPKLQTQNQTAAVPAPVPKAKKKKGFPAFTATPAPAVPAAQPPPAKIEKVKMTEKTDNTTNGLNFELTPKGPLIPPGVNQKSFYSLHLGPQETTALKTGQVLKCTGGKIRVRNANEKGFNAQNSIYVEKGDILAVRGPVVAFNTEPEDNAHFRVFTLDK